MIVTDLIVIDCRIRSSDLPPKFMFLGVFSLEQKVTKPSNIVSSETLVCYENGNIIDIVRDIFLYMYLQF